MQSYNTTTIYKNLDPASDIIYKNYNNIQYSLWQRNLPLRETSSEGTLHTFYTSSADTSSWEHNYYVNAYAQSEASSSNPEILFSMAVGTYTAITSSYVGPEGGNDIADSGMRYATPSYAIYRQMANYLEGGNELVNFTFDSASGETVTMHMIYAITLSRDIFIGEIDPLSFRMNMSGSLAYIYALDTLFENDKYPLYFHQDLTANNVMIGWLYYKKGVIILNARPLELLLVDYIAAAEDGTFYPDRYDSYADPIQTYSATGVNTVGSYAFYPTALTYRILTYIYEGTGFTIFIKKPVISSQYICRISQNEFLHSMNPTWTSGSSDANVIRNSMINDPCVFITSIGLYDGDSAYGGNLIATAKLSRPVKKNDVTSIAIKVRLDT